MSCTNTIVSVLALKTHKAICLYWLSHWNFCSNINLWLFSKLIFFWGGIILHFIWYKELGFFVSHNSEYDLYIYMVFTFVCHVNALYVSLGRFSPQIHCKLTALQLPYITHLRLSNSSSVTCCLSSHQSCFCDIGSWQYM